MNLKDEIEKTEKEIRETQSPYRKRDLTKHLRKLERKINNESNPDSR